LHTKTPKRRWYDEGDFIPFFIGNPGRMIKELNSQTAVKPERRVADKQYRMSLICELKSEKILHQNPVAGDRRINLNPYGPCGQLLIKAAVAA